MTGESKGAFDSPKHNNPEAAKPGHNLDEGGSSLRDERPADHTPEHRMSESGMSDEPVGRAERAREWVADHSRLIVASAAASTAIVFGATHAEKHDSEVSRVSTVVDAPVFRDPADTVPCGDLDRPLTFDVVTEDPSSDRYGVLSDEVVQGLDLAEQQACAPDVPQGLQGITWVVGERVTE